MKIEFYREKISQDAAYATQIRALQEHVHSQVEEQGRTVEEFSLYKQHAEEREQVLLYFNSKPQALRHNFMNIDEPSSSSLNGTKFQIEYCRTGACVCGDLQAINKNLYMYLI